MAYLRIALDARLQDGKSGGVQQFILGLVHGLGQLEDEGEQYLLLTYEGHESWLHPYLSERFTLLPVPAPVQSSSTRSSFARRFPITRQLWRRLPGWAYGPLPRYPSSDGTLERAEVDVVHFTKQGAFSTSIPSIYQPHDLQHVHLPEFLSPRERAARQSHYREASQKASRVAASSSWVKDDFVKHLGVAAEKVVVIPPAPVLGAYPTVFAHQLDECTVRYGLPNRFFLYPAQTWPHKNHIMLLRAAAIARDRLGQEIPLVFTGTRNAHASTIEAVAEQLGLSRSVFFTDFVSPTDLRSLYELCSGVVVPTRFEAASFPIWEAFAAGRPVASSNVTSLPMQVGDAALLFDPTDPAAIAQAMAKLWTDSAVGADLVERGYRRLSQFTWERTARKFRALYRSVSHQSLNSNDIALLNETPLL